MWTVLIISAIIVVAIVIVGKQRTNRLISEGKMIKRDGSFWENEELFVTTTTYDAVLGAVNRTDFSDSGATVYPNANGQNMILFKSKYAWNAAIEYKGERDEKNVFRFAFTAWETNGKTGLPRIDTMNMLLTSVEKMLLSLDPATTVETHALQLKSKTKFF